MKTTFEKVKALNLAFGNPEGNVANPNVKAIRKQAMLCLEEAIEMVEAAHPGAKIFWQWDITAEKPEDTLGVDMHLILDAQGDLTTVNDGVAHIAGFNGNEVYDLVHESNMSKFILDPSDVEEALDYYYNIGFMPEDLYVAGDAGQQCIKVKQDIHLNGKFYPEGKFLKNMATFKEPDFSGLLK